MYLQLMMGAKIGKYQNVSFSDSLKIGVHCCQVLIGHLIFFTFVQKVEVGHTKFMLLKINRGFAETLQVIPFKR